MEIIIHRGSHQIGGSCIEVRANSTRVVLDAGLPLESELGGSGLSLAVQGLFGRNGKPVDALFLSHAHLDHSGLVRESRSDVPVWMSKGTSKMLLAGAIFARQPGVARSRQRVFEPGVPVQIGHIRITPYPVDHSVFDSMAFLVEVENKRVLYTGDLRFHGRKPGMAEGLAAKLYGTPLDALLIEGTRLGVRANEANLSERDLERELAKVCRSARGLVLAMYSPLNIDRFVSYLHAAMSSGRSFVIDPYQAFVLHLIGSQAKLPRGPNKNLRVLVPFGFQTSRAGRLLHHTGWSATLRRHAITAEEIISEPLRYTLLFRSSMQPWLFGNGFPTHTTCVFSYGAGEACPSKARIIKALRRYWRRQLLCYCRNLNGPIRSQRPPVSARIREIPAGTST